MKRLSVFLLTAAMVLSQVFPSWAAASGSFSDVSGHWAGAALQRAASEGILKGSGGKLMPDASLTGGQMAAIVTRDCGIQVWSEVYPGTAAKDWYYRPAAQAYSAGLLPPDGSLSMTGSVTREQVFVVLAKAYLGFKEAPAAAPVPEGPEVPAETETETEPEPNPAETDSDTAPAVTAAEAEGTAEEPGAAGDQEAAEEPGTAGEQAGPAEDPGASAQPGETEDLLSAYADASALSAGGRAAAVLLAEAGVVQGDSKGLLNPEKGITRAEFVTMLYRLKDRGISPTITYEDPNLSRFRNAGISVSASPVPAGGSIQATASFYGMPEGLVYDAVWLLDGNPVKGYYAAGKAFSTGSTSSMTWTPSYTLHMQTAYRAGMELSFKEGGKNYRLYSETPVNVTNYPVSHYVTLADGAKVTKIFDTVQSSYKGNRTSSYNPDYTDITKENFVNSKGYSSSTGYLVWANLATQKVNVFKGSKGNWQLIKCFRCASGAPGSPTPQGVTHVTYKQAGWYTSSYVCKPVVRFYPNTGYAFHSILYTADGKKVKDGSMGYPVSHGCLRMMPESIQWLYDNIPVKTTVVIY